MISGFFIYIYGIVKFDNKKRIKWKSMLVK